MGRKQRQKKQREKKKKDDAFRIILKSKACLKDIGHCRCVCKAWRSFLSTPEFKREHMQNVTIDDYKLLVFDENSRNQLPFRTLSFDETLPRFDPDADNDPRDTSIIKASLDGLVCVAVSRRHQDTLLLLTNPLTGASKRLPSIPYLDSYYTIAFYIDPSSNNNYKLVCLPSYGGDGPYVYSQRLDSWSYTFDFSVSRPEDLHCCSPPTFCDECLYFEASSFDSNRLICFDVKTETFKEIPVPGLATGATYHSSLGLVVLKGCLHLYVSYHYYDNISGDVNGVDVDVWRLKKDEHELEKVDAFTLKEEEKRQLICTQTAGDWLAVLDQDDNSFKKMTTEDFTTHYRCFFSPFSAYNLSRVIYVQTLVDP